MIVIFGKFFVFLSKYFINSSTFHRQRASSILTNLKLCINAMFSDSEYSMLLPQSDSYNGNKFIIETKKKMVTNKFRMIYTNITSLDEKLWGYWNGKHFFFTERQIKFGAASKRDIIVGSKSSQASPTLYITIVDIDVNKIGKPPWNDISWNNVNL